MEPLFVFLKCVTREKFIGGKMRILAIVLFALVILIMFLSAEMAWSQSTGNITGRTLNAETGRALIGAHVILEGTSYGTATSQNGTYRLQ